MSKQYRPWSPDQTFLLPPSPTEWLPDGHLAYFVLDVVAELDLGDIEASIQRKDPRGERPYAPRMMTSLLVYGYCTGIFSSRKLERATYEDVACRVIAAGSHPHWTTINGFRLDHREALAKLFVQVLRLCARAGLKTLGHVALDGTKVQANASKHKAMSYGRMQEEETRLVGEIAALMQRADEADAQETAKHGAARGDEVPEELRRRQARLDRIRQAKTALEKEAAEGRAAELRDNAAALLEKAEVEATPAREKKAAVTRAAKSEQAADKLAPRDDDDDDDGPPPTELRTHRPAATTTGKPKPEAQRNFTDPDSRIMIRNGVFLQAFNAQAAVSLDQVIVAHGLTNDATDAQHLIPMLARVDENTGEPPEVLTADTGYLSATNIQACRKMGVDAYIPARKSDAAKLIAVPDTPKLLVHWAMQNKVSSPWGRRIYAYRKILVEPVFGQIKAAMGFRRFSLRGLGKATAEWGFVCTCHNLLKAFRATQRQPATA